MNGGYGMGSGMAWGWLFFAVLILSVALLVVLLVMAFARGGSGGRVEPTRGSVSSARDILDQRYARGEIDTAEYQERLKQLGERG